MESVVLSVFISKLRLDVENKSVIQCVKCCQDMHINIMQGFKGNGTREEAGVLYRVQVIASKLYVYVQSNVEPDWAILKKDGFDCEFVTNSDSLLSRIFDGSNVKFTLSCIPYEYKEGKKYKTLLRTETERMQWLSKRGDQYGFDLLSYNELGDVTRTVGVRRNDKVGFDNVLIEGTLKVTNRENFLSTLEKGIGPEKAYGQGLLLLVGIK